MYVPGPVQCKNCIGFDHTSKQCIHKPRCLHCGLRGHNYVACKTKDTGSARCANYGVGHNAMNKTCPKYIQVRDRLRRTAVTRIQTYGYALAGDTNTVVATAAGTPNEVNANFESIKIYFETSLDKFTAQFTSDMQKVFGEYGNEI